MEEKTLKVDILLSDNQKRGERWLLTHYGEEKLVTRSSVQFYAENMEEALKAIKVEEIIKLWFEGVPYHLDEISYEKDLIRAYTRTGNAINGVVNHSLVLQECLAASSDLKIVIDKLNIIISQKKNGA